jgi:phosphoribosylglycinamide formyltransferase 1
LLKIAVFASGRGSNFLALYEALENNAIDASIAVLISNNSNAGAVESARACGIPVRHLSQRLYATEQEYITALRETLRSFGTDLIVLAGYMKKLAPEIIGAYRSRIINIHPALLPEFGGKGMYGQRVHEAVIASGARFSGATVHFVDAEFDHGEILLQERVPVFEGDTPQSLAERVLAVEHRILPEAVRMISEQIGHHKE